MMEPSPKGRRGLRRRGRSRRARVRPPGRSIPGAGAGPPIEGNGAKGLADRRAHGAGRGGAGRARGAGRGGAWYGTWCCQYLLPHPAVWAFASPPAVPIIFRNTALVLTLSVAFFLTIPLEPDDVGPVGFFFRFFFSNNKYMVYRFSLSDVFPH